MSPFLNEHGRHFTHSFPGSPCSRQPAEASTISAPEISRPQRSLFPNEQFPHAAHASLSKCSLRLILSGAEAGTLLPPGRHRSSRLIFAIFASFAFLFSSTLEGSLRPAAVGFWPGGWKAPAPLAGAASYCFRFSRLFHCSLITRHFSFAPSALLPQNPEAPDNPRRKDSNQGGQECPPSFSNTPVLLD